MAMASRLRGRACESAHEHEHHGDAERHENGGRDLLRDRVHGEEEEAGQQRLHEAPHATDCTPQRLRGRSLAGFDAPEAGATGRLGQGGANIRLS